MSLASALLARITRLPRAQTEDVVCEKDLRVTADDGVVLLADRWVPRATRDEPQPTVLVRSPYGRRQVFGLIFAERGLQVVIQSTRGTFGSGGTFQTSGMCAVPDHLRFAVDNAAAGDLRRLLDRTLSALQISLDADDVRVIRPAGGRLRGPRPQPAGIRTSAITP